MHARSFDWRGLGLGILLTTVLGAVGQAQRPVRSAPPTPRSLDRSCGLQELDGGLWAVGPRYKAEFRRDGVEFTPALGSAAPHNLPLRLTAIAIGRGAERQPVEAVDARHGELQVRYERAACTERYDVTPDGLELSFVFDRLPAGEGDLVVRLAVASELPLVASGADGLRFEAEGIGGVAIGGVSGIDADGRRCTGTIASDGHEIELRLPRTFIDGASLPLVLDPQVGAVVAVTNSPVDYGRPALASRGQLSYSYLCAFEVTFSATDKDIRVQVLQQDCSVWGALLAVTNSSTVAESAPTVAVVALNDQFVIAYEKGSGIAARSLTNQVLGSEIQVVATTDTVHGPRLAGELTTVDNDALCVYHNQTQGRIEATQIQVATSGALNAFAPVTIVSDSAFATVTSPRISHHGGRVGRYLIVYSSNAGGGASSPRGVVVDRNLNVLASATLVSASSDDDATDVDGDGDQWVVVYETRASLLSLDSDVRAVPVTFDAGTSTLVPGTSAVVTAVLNTNERSPAVGFLGGSYIVAWQRQAGLGSANYEMFMKSIDVFTCAECEPTILLANTADSEQSAAIATFPDDPFQSVFGVGVVLWDKRHLAAGGGDLEGIDYASGDGIYEGPMFGCGQGGDVAVSCARIGNAGFRVRFRHARAATPAWLVLSSTLTSLSCGGCGLRADPFAGVLLAGPSTDVHGNAEAPLAIPNAPALAGISLWAQWIVVHPAGLCSYVGADFSSFMNFIIE